jgi:hypothetical protein
VREAAKQLKLIILPNPEASAPETLRSFFHSLLPQGFSGAELANVVNEAALLAARKGGDFVTIRCDALRLPSDEVLSSSASLRFWSPPSAFGGLRLLG